MKQTESFTKYRPHAFVDYYNVDDAKTAKREMYDEDSFGQRRSDLGDKSCEILFAIKKRNKDFSLGRLAAADTLLAGSSTMLGVRPQFAGQPLYH